MSWTPEQIDTIVRAVVERSISDPQFRELALKDSCAAFTQIAGAPPPSDFDVRFADNGGNGVAVVSPPANEGELGDEQLGKVAGAGYGIGGVTPVRPGTEGP